MCDGINKNYGEKFATRIGENEKDMSGARIWRAKPKLPYIHPDSGPTEHASKKKATKGIEEKAMIFAGKTFRSFLVR